MLLNPAPNELFWTALTPQPWLEVSAAAQLVPPTTLPVIASAVLFDVGIEHPGFVWMVAWLFVYVLTPSTMSISPPAGQLGPALVH